MTKPMSEFALQRSAARKAIARMRSEGSSNLGEAAMIAGCVAEFADFHFVMGLAAEVRGWSAERKRKLAERGRELYASLVVPVPEASNASEIIVRLPLGDAGIGDVTPRLVAAGLRRTRRTTAPYIEMRGHADEATVRALVEEAGGRITVVQTPVSPGDQPTPGEAASGEPQQSTDQGEPAEIVLDGSADAQVSTGESGVAPSGPPPLAPPLAPRPSTISVEVADAPAKPQIPHVTERPAASPPHPFFDAVRSGQDRDLVSVLARSAPPSFLGRDVPAAPSRPSVRLPPVVRAPEPKAASTVPLSGSSSPARPSGDGS